MTCYTTLGESGVHHTVEPTHCECERSCVVDGFMKKCLVRKEEEAKEGLKWERQSYL